MKYVYLHSWSNEQREVTVINTREMVIQCSFAFLSVAKHFKLLYLLPVYTLIMRICFVMKCTFFFYFVCQKNFIVVNCKVKQKMLLRGLRANTNWLEIMIMCPCGTTILPGD